jgi:hypothetical protein
VTWFGIAGIRKPTVKSFFRVGATLRVLYAR